MDEFINERMRNSYEADKLRERASKAVELDSGSSGSEIVRQN